jgi:ApaG protein
VSDRHQIQVAVESAYLEEQSEPAEHRFVFAYTVTLHNSGQVPAKLLTRHWIITDANGRTQEVRGEGVVDARELSDAGRRRPALRCADPGVPTRQARAPALSAGRPGMSRP